MENSLNRPISPDDPFAAKAHRVSPEEHERLAMEAVIAENSRAAAEAEADRLLAEEQQAGIERVLIDAADKLDQLANAVPAGKEIHKTAAWALAAKFRAMCRFRAVSDEELRRFRLRALMFRAWPNPPDWPVDPRTFRNLGPNSYKTQKLLDLRDCLVAALGDDYEDEVDFLLYLDEQDGPSRGLTGSEKKDLKEALEGLHGAERRLKERQLKGRWYETKRAEIEAQKYARQGQARAIWESNIRQIRAKAPKKAMAIPPNSGTTQEPSVQ